MAYGWIQLHRKIRDCWVWENPLYLKAWLYILFAANYKEKKILFDGKITAIKRGQFITSQRRLAADWGCNVKTVRNILNLMEEQEMVTLTTTGNGTLLTVINYDFYQSLETENGTPTTTQTTTLDGTRSTTLDGTQNGTPTGHNEECINNVSNNVLNNVEHGNNDLPPLPPTGESETKPNRVQEVIDLYNEICISLPRTRTMSDSRRKAIKARLKSHTMEEIREVFENAESSDFLSGKKKDWKANLDWLMNDTNFCKVLEGTYNRNDKSYTDIWGVEQMEVIDEFTGN